MLIDAAQDDDVDTDEEVLRSGTQTCYRDLLVVKDWLGHDPRKVRKSLKTWRIWAPHFQGRLPTREQAPSRHTRFASMDRFCSSNASRARIGY